MDSKLRIIAENGQVLRPNKDKPEYGFIILGQVTLEVDQRTQWLRPKKRSALLSVKLSDFEGIELTHGDEFPGKIYIVEQTNHFEGINPEKTIKRKGKDGDIVTHLGAEVHRKTFHTYDMAVIDTLLSTDKEEVGVVAANTEFEDENPL